MSTTVVGQGWLEQFYAVYRRHRFLLVFLPALLMVSLFFFIPIFSLLRISFFEYVGMGNYEPGFTLASYAKFLTDPFYIGVILYTLKIASIVTIICLIFGYPVAYYISSTSGKLKIFLLLLLIVPLWTNLIVRIYGWFVILGSNGLVNSVLLSLQLVDQPAEMVFTTFSVVIGLVDNVMPWILLILISVMEGINWPIIEAARDLGANPVKCFYEITFKLSLPGVAVAGLFAFVWSVGEYAVPSLLGSSAKRTMSIEIADQMLTVLNWPFGASMAFILFLVSVCVLMLSNKLSGRAKNY
jgi:ABC-type spermidine/putrescine transport system permease subunit I